MLKVYFKGCFGKKLVTKGGFLVGRISFIYVIADILEHALKYFEKWKFATKVTYHLEGKKYDIYLLLYYMEDSGVPFEYNPRRNRLTLYKKDLEQEKKVVRCIINFSKSLQ